MAVIIPSGTVPRTISPASAWNSVASTLNGGKWQFTFTPTLASSNSSYNDWHALVVANDVGGLYIIGGSRSLALHNNTGGGTAVFTQAITWNAGQAITVTIDLVAGANASSVTISGALTGNGTFNFTTSGTYFTSSATLGIGRFPGDTFYDFNGSISAIDDTLPAGASGSANVGGITASGAAITGTLASGSANVAGITSSGAASTPGTAGGSANVGDISSTGGAASPAFASGSANVGGIASSGSAGQSLFGTIGASSAGQRADQTGATTGTLSTAFIARTPSASVAINARLAFNNRRWHVHTAGTLGAGSGPTGTGQQSDGTASLVALTSTDTALTMTTQPSNSVMLAVVMRENWSSDTSAPTDNKGNTYTLEDGPHSYAGFASASSALFVAKNAVGGASHAVSASWPQKVSTGAELSLLAVEIPTGRSTAIVQDTSFIERTSASSVTSASVTTTGPAMLVAFWLGSGNVLSVGTVHPGSPQAPFTAIPNADTAVAIHNNGYIQAKSAYAYVTEPGTYTATWTGTNEGAQLYLVAIQEAPGTLASGTASVGGITGAGLAGPGASGTGAVAGVTSTGVAGSSSSSSSANGGGPVGGVTSSGETAIAALGATTLGGVTSSGSAITGKQASGAAAVGGIGSAGVVVVPGEASGVSAVGGVGSSGTIGVGTFADGTADVGGIASLGNAVAAGPVSTPFGDLIAAMDAIVIDHLG